MSYSSRTDYRYDYESVVSQQTDRVLGDVGNAGDILQRIIFVPSSTSAGQVSIKDGAAGTPIVVFDGGASSLSNKITNSVEIGAKANERWIVTTGTAISIIAVGRFT